MWMVIENCTVTAILQGEILKIPELFMHCNAGVIEILIMMALQDLLQITVK